MAIGLYRNIPDYTWRLESSIARISIQIKQRTDKYGILIIVKMKENDDLGFA